MKLRGKDTLSALQFKLLSYDFFLAPRMFTEVPFLVAIAPKTLGVKISSYLKRSSHKDCFFLKTVKRNYLS